MTEPAITLGIGCETNCPPEELAILVRHSLEQAGLSHRPVACLATLDRRVETTAIQSLARALAVPVRGFTVARLNDQAPRLRTPSPRVLAAIGCPGVAEGAALAAAGENGVLLVPKVKSAHATLAVAARSPDSPPNRS